MKGVTACQVNFVATVVKRVAKECSMVSTAITNSPESMKYHIEKVVSLVLCQMNN